MTANTPVVVAPVVSVVIVNLGRRELLLACLESVERAAERVAGAVEVIVVDNGSDDDSVPSVRRAHPAVRLIENPQNAGFSPAVQQGIDTGAGDWVLTLNNDATVAPGALEALLEAADHADGHVGMLAAQMRFMDRPGVINSAGLQIDVLGVAVDRLLGVLADGQPEHGPVPVFGASAGAALYRRAMLEQIGGFDVSFFTYLEDADVAWRAAARGWRALYVPTAVVWHHHSATAIHRSRAKLFLTGRNRVRMLAKNAPVRLLLRQGPAMLAYDAGYVLYFLVAQRTLAPLAGRIAGLLEWRRYRRIGSDRAGAPLVGRRGIRAALTRNRAWTGS